MDIVEFLMRFGLFLALGAGICALNGLLYLRFPSKAENDEWADEAVRSEAHQEVPVFRLGAFPAPTFSVAPK